MYETVLRVVSDGAICDYRTLEKTKQGPDLNEVPSAPRAFETRLALSGRSEAKKESEVKETELLNKNAPYTSLVFQIMRHEITLPIEDAYLD